MAKLIKETLSKQIYDILKADIIEQRIPCGEKITLKALQERFELSSTPIREAIKALSSQGLINDVTNVGARVITFNQNDIIEIYDYCFILDSAALRLSMERDSKSFGLTIEKCVKAQKEALDNKDLNSFKRHSDDFHDIFFRFAANRRLYDASERLRSQLSILTARYQSEDIARSVVFVEHTQIAGAIAANNPRKAEELLRQHFEHEKNYLLSNSRAD